MENSPSDYLFDVVVVLGSGIKPTPKGFEPDSWTQDRLIAATQAFRRGLSPEFFFAGGHSSGLKAPAESEVMFEYTTQILTQNQDLTSIPPWAISLDQRSLSTAANIMEFQRLKSPRWQRVGVLSNDFQLCRAIILAANFGLFLAPVPAEMLLGQLGGTYLERARQHQDSISLQQRLAVEARLIKWLKYDPQNLVLRLASQPIRPFKMALYHHFQTARSE